MLSPQKAGLLQAFLGSLTEPLAARLTKAVEIDRLADGATLPHDVILEGLRPVLRRAKTRDRMPTPLRLFCRPFEDILTSAPRAEKRKGRIARSSVIPVWNWVGTTLMREDTLAYTREIKALLVAQNAGDASARAIAFWTEAAASIREALATEEGREKARTALDGTLAVADADEMALLLGVGAEILALQDKLPKPVSSFTETLVCEAKDVCLRLLETAPDAAPYLPVVAMNRLRHPCESLRLALHFSRKGQDTLVASTDMGLVGEILFDELEALSQAIRNARHPNFDGEALIANVARFADLSSAVVKEIALRRDGKWGQALFKDRAEVGNVMDGFMQRVQKEIAAALPMRKIGTRSSLRVPDFTRTVDPEKIERTLRYAALVAGSRPFAAAASFTASLKAAEEEASDYLRHYGEAVVEEIRTAKGSTCKIVKDQFALVTELTSILRGKEEANLLRRRGRPAAQAA